MKNAGTPDGTRRNGRSRSRRWIIAALIVLVAIGAATITYYSIKFKRAEQFAAKADALVAEGKFNEASVQYRVALETNPRNYRALTGAARLTSRAERPEAIELWQRVMQLPSCTVGDRQEYADFLLKTNRLTLAQKIIDDLLKRAPEPKTLQLASLYSRKTGDNPKAIEYVRIASKRAPQDDATRFQLADLLAQSTDAAEQSEARQVLWELSTKPGPYGKAAVEALARAPELTDEERHRLLEALSSFTPKNITDDLLAADLQIHLNPDVAPRIYKDQITRWQGGQTEDLLQLARWLNIHKQAELVLSLFSMERALEDNQLLLSRLDALATLQRWDEIDDVLNRTDVTLDPTVIESFRARTAQERGASLDAEGHWNHAMSLAATDPFKLRFVANFAEQSQATAAALKAYDQLARYPEQADFAYRGLQRVSQKNGDTATQRNAMAKIVSRSPDDPNAADQLAYLNLLLGEDIDKNFADARKLAERFPNRLSYRVTAALGYLREHDPASALAQFNAPVPVDWKRTLPGWRAVYAAALLGTDQNGKAREMIATIPMDRLNPQERALIQPAADSR
jgi:tetratricopeptide (TPR) repeat protein